MTPPSEARLLRIALEVASDDELSALRGALLAARATELSEIERRSQRHGLGYGTESARDSMSDEVAQLRRRWTMLDRLIESIEKVEVTAAADPDGPADPDGQRPPQSAQRL